LGAWREEPSENHRGLGTGLPGADKSTIIEGGDMDSNPGTDSYAETGAKIASRRSGSEVSSDGLKITL